MPSFEDHGAHIHYEEFGQGFPVLTFAPAGLQSVIAVWVRLPRRSTRGPNSPPISASSRWINAMPAVNPAPRSRPRDGWDDYTADHIALLDHLRIDRCHLYGQCIGGSFIINMLKRHPERVASAVLAQPIGRVGPMAPGRPARFNGWAETLTDHPEATPQVLDAFADNLYAPGFVYCADRDFVKTIKTPCLLLAGNDDAHPWPISEELSKLLPDCEFIPEWKSGAALDAARPKVKAFLAKHTPGR